MNFVRARDHMMQSQLIARGISDKRVLRAMMQVPREEFVPSHSRDRAYADCPLPIGCDQTISQPYVVALMLQELRLRPEDRALEIGTGSGYAAAVLSLLVREVHTVERYPRLAAEAARRLHRLAYDNVTVYHGDGTMGLPQQAPFQAILVSAAGTEMPSVLGGQLAIGGRIVLPVGRGSSQTLLRVYRTAENRYREEELGSVRFVPLIGEGAPPAPVPPEEG
ncbi:MAG: protein-L-isoaspartate(D-aspartate) O-methyltransferase [Armatimonadetes bacterium]|nr:protein-L-isoaspartate(D-aspartate) O-methyltransferase [Armatimonadota bacterium]